MRILILNYEWPPLGGGAGNATYYILKEFSKEPNLKIDLVTSSIGKYREEDFSKNIKIYYMDIGKKGNLHYQSNKDLLKYSMKAYSFSKKLVRKNDYILAHAFFGIPCGYIAMKLGLPYIVSLRGSDVPFYNKRFYWLDKLLFRRFSRKIWSNALDVIALSNDLRKLAHRTKNNIKMRVIYNGINTKEFYPDYNKRYKEETFNILFVGRLIERKGLQYLFDAFNELAKSKKNFRLLIAGEGPLKNKFITYCKTNKLQNYVEFLGIVQHDKLNNIYQKSHVFVLPSLNEALGNVTLEAMACGLPIITTNTGAAELVNKANGIIVDKCNSKQISNAIIKIYNNSELLKSYSKSSRQKTMLLDWKNTADKYYSLYMSHAQLS